MTSLVKRFSSALTVKDITVSMWVLFLFVLWDFCSCSKRENVQQKQAVMGLLHRDPSCFKLIPEKHLVLFWERTSCLPLSLFLWDVLYLLMHVSKDTTATLLKPQYHELNTWCLCVFVGRAAAAGRAVYRRGTGGLWGFSWLSEHLKGRLLSRSSHREHRPLSVLFVASWRPLLNQELCLCLSTARWKHSILKRAINFMCTGPGEL